MSTLAIVGAGAKAVAVAAKAAELRGMGVAVPDVVAVERSGVAANWRSDGGWTVSIDWARVPRRMSDSRTVPRGCPAATPNSTSG